jgi:hypothetical protein
MPALEAGDCESKEVVGYTREATEESPVDIDDFQSRWPFFSFSW